MDKPISGLEFFAMIFGAFVIGYNISALFGVLAFVGYFIFRLVKMNSAKDKDADKYEKYNKKNQEEFLKLGETQIEREKKINEIFDTKKANISASFLYKTTYKPNEYTIWFTLSRNLSIMEPKERELLRAVLLMFNENKISLKQYNYYLFALVNGNGKASIDDIGWNEFIPPLSQKVDSYSATEYMNKHCFINSSSVVKYSLERYDASVDSAITNIIATMDSIKKGDTSPKTIEKIEKNIYGGSAWFSESDIENSIFKQQTSYNLKLGLLSESEKELTYSSEGSLITIAPPGAGKTQCFVIPNMLNWKGGALVLDVKGEIYNATSEWRKENVGTVFKFSPLDPNTSNQYNPLTAIRQDSEYIWEDSKFLADMMIPPSNATDPFWENKAKEILAAAIAYVSMHNSPENRFMSKVIDIIYGIGWDEMIISLKTNVLVSAMPRTAASLSSMETKTKDSVLQTAQSSLNAWQGERIERITKKSDWNPLDLRNKNATVYICVNPNEIDSYLSILRVFIAQHIRIMTSELPPRDVAPVLFMLDEMPRLKNMPPIDEALNVGRQYGIKLWMFAQSYGQLKEAYSNPEGILGSCAIRIFMNVPLNDELATKLSDQLGFRDGPLDATRQKLVEPIELAGPNYKDIALILATSTKPVKIKKKFAYESAEINNKN